MTLPDDALKHPSPPSCRRRLRLRHALLRLARRLGLDRRDLAAYAEATCGRPLGALGSGDLMLVREDLAELAASRAALRRELHPRLEGRPRD